MGIFDSIGNAVSGAVDFVGDVASGAADVVGDVVGGAAGLVVDGVEAGVGLVGDAFGFVGDVAGGVISTVTDFIKNPFGSIVDFFPGILDVPGIEPFPKNDSGLPDLSGLDPMTALFVIMSAIEEQLGETMQKLGTLTQIQSLLQDAKNQDLLEGTGSEHYDAAKAGLGAQFGEEFANLELADVSSAINTLTFGVQRAESYRQQLNTMVSNVLASDHEAKMVTLRNIPTR